MSAVAHDLRFRLQSFEITLEGSAVVGEFELRSLLVEGPMQRGSLQAEQYDAGKRAEVAKAMHEDVLHTDQHPKAIFTGSALPVADGYQVEGQLQLAGRSQALAFQVRKDGETYRAEFQLQPSRWGIRQYKALLGAIKLKDTLKIELALTEA